MSAIPTLFGRVRLGYALVESSRMDEWRRFGVDGLGLHADLPEPGVLAFRVDEHERRLVVAKGPAEDVISLGWQLDDDDALALAVARAQTLGAKVTEASGEAAALRGVERFYTFDGPKRLKVELFTAARCSTVPLDMLASGFLTGAGGLGHVAITTRKPEKMQEFYQRLFDARLSDRIIDRASGVDLEITFLRVNERHHSVATAATRGVRLDPLRTRIHHMNLQAKSLEDVTEGYLRCRRMGYAITNAIGQHPNDRELSFYVASPSGFEIELGWNPITVSSDAEAAWQPAEYRGISLWGHFPESLTTRVKLAQLCQGLASLTRDEYEVGSSQ